MLNKPTPALWSIISRKKRTVEVAWIGETEPYKAYKGFEAGTRGCPDLPFERYRVYGQEHDAEFEHSNGMNKHDANPTQRMIGWMRLVITDRRVVDAGDYCVAVNNRSGHFSYRNYSFLTTGDNRFVLDASGRMVLQTSQEQREYAFSGLASEPGSRQGVAFYFVRGPVGYLMISDGGRVLDRKVTYTGLSPIEFCRKCKEDWGVILRPLVLSMDDPANFAPEHELGLWTYNPPS